MSMFIQSIPAWKEMDNWAAGQKAMNDQVFANQPDYGAVFADIMTGFYAGNVTLTFQTALGRVQTAVNASKAALGSVLDKTV